MAAGFTILRVVLLFFKSAFTSPVLGLISSARNTRITGYVYKVFLLFEYVGQSSYKEIFNQVGLPDNQMPSTHFKIEPQNVLLPPLHLKLGLMKGFVKAMDKTGEGFLYLKFVFPKLSDAKLIEGVFVGPQIRKLTNDANFDLNINKKDPAAWTLLKVVINGFSGNHRADNYKDLGCRMPLKIHFLYSNFDFFPKMLVAVSEEQRERFRQDIKKIDERYRGRWDVVMLGDYCWYLMREDSTSHKRKG